MLKQSLLQEAQDLVITTSSKKHTATMIFPNSAITCKTIDTRVGDQPHWGQYIVEPLLIKNATEQGYLQAECGDGVDISSRMQYHRGTVQKGLSQTLNTAGGESQGVIVNE